MLMVNGEQFVMIILMKMATLLLLLLLNLDSTPVMLLIGMVHTQECQLTLTAKEENNVLVLKPDLLIVLTKFMEIITVDIKKM